VNFCVGFIYSNSRRRVDSAKYDESTLFSQATFFR